MPQHWQHKDSDYIHCIVIDPPTDAHPFGEADRWEDPNVVKVLVDRAGPALYFSRAGVPGVFPGGGADPRAAALRHVGIYAWRTGALRRYLAWPRGPLETVEGLERYPVNLRYPRGARDSVEKLKDLAVVTPSGKQIPLSAVADIRVEDGPPMIKSENARLNGWVFLDIEGVDLGSYVDAARQVVAEQVELPAGYSLSWSGQYEYMERARARLAVVGPITIVTIVLLLFGTKRLKNVGSDLGGAIKGFRKAMKDGVVEKDEPESLEKKEQDNVIEGESTRQKDKV